MKHLIAKCFKCDTEMINIGNSGLSHFICPNGCSSIGPMLDVLLTQKILDEDYEHHKKELIK